MPVPPPEPGLVVRFDYLFDNPKYASRKHDKQGEKDRPCVIVLAIKEAETGEHMVTVAPITATEPQDTAVVVEIPRPVRQQLGLTGEGKQSWVILDDLNETEWPGFDLKKVPGTDRFEYGFLPPKFYDRLASRFVELVQAHRVKVTPRHDEPEARHTGRDVAARLRKQRAKPG